ncbi:MAG TPA: dienelactone hydrolase family protein [Acidimicrobiales bacterium]|nr:dienelactone hydrolase family protein [Acidimicrobiales bacterium]
MSEPASEPKARSDPLEGYRASTATYRGKRRDVFRAGSGPAVVVIHEVPGITPAVADFGRKVADAGCTAVLPSLFGEPGKAPTTAYGLARLVGVCVSREFTAFRRGQASPITVWLRDLARDAHAECGGPGVGVVGMCATGGFALAMMVDDTVLAPVLSQPSLPAAVTRRQKADLGLSADDLALVKERVAGGTCVLGLRYKDDPLVPEARFQRLRDELGAGFEAVEFDGRQHSVLTEHLQPEGVARVIEFLRERLEVA